MFLNNACIKLRERVKIKLQESTHFCKLCLKSCEKLMYAIISVSSIITNIKARHFITMLCQQLCQTHYDSHSLFGTECRDYKDHLSVITATLTLVRDSNGGSEPLFIIVWHTVANDPYRDDTR